MFNLPLRESHQYSKSWAIGVAIRITESPSPIYLILTFPVLIKSLQMLIHKISEMMNISEIKQIIRAVNILLKEYDLDDLREPN